MSIFASLRRFMGLAVFSVAAGPLYADGPSAEATKKVQGQVTGYADLSRDGWVDVSAVFPTLTEEQLLSFDFNSLLSPNEPMKAGPVETEVPGNLHVPEQKERYGIIPVTLRKESFTLMMEPGQERELAVIALRGPFSDFVEMGRRKAPPAEMFKLLKFGQLGYHDARDWTRERVVSLGLNRQRPRSTTVSWSRSAPAASDADFIVNFEETPTKHWLVSDMDTDPKASSTVKSTSFTGLAKLMLARATFAANNQDLKHMRAWFPSYTRGARVTATSVPNLIQGVKWATPNTLTWEPSSKKGWVTVFREELLPRSDGRGPDESQIFFPDLSRLVDVTRPRIFAGWVRVEDGQLHFDAATMAKSRLVFVFLGGDDLIDGPALAGANELQVHDVTP